MLHFNTHAKCDSVDNNMSKIFNGTIIEARFKPILSMLKEIYNKTIERVDIRKEWVARLKQAVARRIISKIEKGKTKVRWW